MRGSEFFLPFASVFAEGEPGYDFKIDKVKMVVCICKLVNQADCPRMTKANKEKRNQKHSVLSK